MKCSATIEGWIREECEGRGQRELGEVKTNRIPLEFSKLNDSSTNHTVSSILDDDITYNYLVSSTYTFLFMAIISYFLLVYSRYSQ